MEENRQRKQRSDELRLRADGLGKSEVATGASWDFAESYGGWFEVSKEASRESEEEETKASLLAILTTPGRDRRATVQNIREMIAKQSRMRDFGQDLRDMADMRCLWLAVQEHLRVLN
ncbi:hypothetical protein M5K25_008467 [Dendrobium thyrsiflorum]|uniref:Uncharacterized protein n=1 Tax=Dendrobium thyrsiflorum TaxID=117978 RepID=A0ABD0VFI9_DENTH